MEEAVNAVEIERPDAHIYVPFTKSVAHDDGTVTVVGKISSEAVDFDGQIVDRDMLKRLLPKWARWSNVREMHAAKAIGRGLDYWWDDDGDPVVMARIVDPDACKKVEHGVLQGFSVGLHRPKIKPDREAPKGRIYDAEDMHEISAVDRPANPDSSFAVVKSAGGGAYLDCQTGETFKAVDLDEGVRRPGGVPDIAGDGHLIRSAERAGNVHPPTGNNSADFDSMGNPILQPGHVRSNAADVTVVAMDGRGATIRVGQDEYVVPYTTESDGSVHFLLDQMVRLPFDPKALPDDPREHLRAPGDSGKGAEAMGAAVATLPPSEADKGVWSTAYVDALPDAAFAYVEPGAADDKSKRHLPYKGEDGKPDAAHVRNALARLDQTDIPEEAKAEAKRRLEAAAKEVGVEVGEPAKVADIRKAAEDRIKTHGFCQACRKQVKLGDKMSDEQGVGGSHAIYKGECGHAVRRFEPEATVPEGTPKEAAAKGADTTPPSGMGAEAGSVKGNTTGERPSGVDPAERQEDDIITRLRSALNEYEGAHKAEVDGHGGEGAESRALAKLKELVSAGVAVQQQEAIEGKAAGAKADIAATVKAAVAKALEELAPGIRKAAHAENRRRLRDAHKRLGSLIDEFGSDPIEGHERGVPQGGHSDGAAGADGGKKGVDPNPGATNPQRGASDDANSDRLAPVKSGEWLERVREGMREVEELARIVAGAQEPLEEGGKDKGGRLEDGKPVPGDKRPGGQQWDFTAGDGGGAPASRGEDADRMHKAAAMTADAIQAAIARGIEIGSEVANKAAAAAFAPIVKRLESVEHMARPAQAPVTPADRGDGFGDPRPQQQVDAQLRNALSDLPPRERNAATIDMISAVRRRQGAQ